MMSIGTVAIVCPRRRGKTSAPIELKKHKKPFSKLKSFFKVFCGWEANQGPFLHFIYFSALYRLAITALLLKYAL
jgi:hypothetical protein